MKQSIFERLTRLLPDEVVHASYSGVLHRAPDTKGLEEYRASVKRLGISGVVSDLARSDEHWKMLVAARSTELVYALYRGLLGREPEPEGLEIFAAKLAETRDLAPLLAEIACSNEHWERSFFGHAPEIVRALYQGLLGREPEPEGLKSYAARLTETCDLAPLLAEIARSDEHWERSFSGHAPEIVRALYQGLLGREPEPVGLEIYAAKLAETHDLAPLLAEIACSNEHWERSFSGHAPEIVRALYQGLLGREPEPEGLKSYAARLTETCDLAPLLAEAARSDEHWKRSFSARAPDVVRALYQGLLGREPEPEGLKSYAAKLAGTSDLAPLLAEIARSDEHWERSFAAHAPDFVRALYQGLLGREPEPDALKSYGAALAETCDLRSLIVAIGGSKEHENYIIRKRWRSQLDSLYTAFLQRAPNEAEISLWSGIRSVAGPEENFQLVTKSLILNLIRTSKRGSAASDASAPRRLHILFVHGSKKEKDSLFPLFDKLREEGVLSHAVAMLDTVSAVDYYIARPDDQYLVITAIEGCHRKLKAVGLRAVFVYLEHGVAPLKSYTYAGHYTNFDYSLLPGRLWCERLELLYPELREKRLFTVGYPKLDNRIVDSTKRSTYADRLKLAHDKKTVLFAPTWSGGDRERGIFNIKYLSDIENCIAIPHDGDVEIARTLKSEGFPIHIMSEGESISEHYAYADILITDISSTAVEFARLGKPVICMKMPSYPDLGQEFIDTDGIPKVPHTPYKWNFCPVVDRSQISVEFRKLIASIDEDSWPVAIPEVVEKMCACYGQEALERCMAAINEIIDKNIVGHNN